MLTARVSRTPHQLPVSLGPLSHDSRVETEEPASAAERVSGYHRRAD